MERHVYDINQPQGSMSLENLRNSLRGLFQLDLMPLRPRASMFVDDFEYPTDAQAQAQWSGTGCTVTKSTTKQEGNYALQVVIDATGNRSLAKTTTLNLSAFTSIKIWERCSATSSAIQFYLRDSSGNESYWNITTNATANTWQQDSVTLSTPDSNNGSNAVLSAITSFGFKGLDASATYIIDTIKATVGMAVAIEGYDNADYHKHTWVLESAPLSFTTKASPTITAPSANPRIDLLVVDSSGVLSWIAGKESSTPVAPDAVSGKIPICYVYCKTTMAKVVDYEDKDANPNEGYIYKDVRPFLSYKSQSFIKDTDGNTKIQTEKNTNEDKIRFDTAGTERAVIDSNGLTLQTGASVKEFSTDGTLSDNVDTAVPTEKAVKTYIDGKLSKHYKHGGLVRTSVNNIVVEPAFAWLNGNILSGSAEISKDVTTSGNYISGSTNKYNTEGFVYVYLKDDGVGGYEVWLSGDAPDKSDCSDSATTGKLIYRKFSSVWYRCLGARYKLAGSLAIHYVSNNGFVQYGSFLSVASNIDSGNSYDAKIPLTAECGYFELYCESSSSGGSAIYIAPNSSASNLQQQYQLAGVQEKFYTSVNCLTVLDTGLRKVYVSGIRGASAANSVKTIGFWEII